ncbi:MAG: carbamoyltransferase [Ekhidna sp.]
MNILGIMELHQGSSYARKSFPNLSEREYAMTFGHDSAAAIINNNEIVAAASEERFNREKHSSHFPINAIEYCLQTANLKLDDIDYIARGFDFESAKKYYQMGDYDLFSEVLSRKAQLLTLSQFIPDYDWSKQEKKLVDVSHHIAHAASTFYVSGFGSALILIADGIGEFRTTTVAIGKGNKIEVIKKINNPNSLGWLYNAFTHYLGFFMNSDEYKVMGLAPYGNPQRFFSRVMDLVKLKDDGTYKIPILSKNITSLEKLTFGGTLNILSEMFGLPREPKTEITQRDMDIAAALQATLEEVLMHVLRHWQKETGETNLCMAGGVALNCTANGVIKKSKLFKNMFTQPASGDDGIALGAALYVQRCHKSDLSNKKIELPLWGPSYTNEEIERVIQERTECETTYFDSFEDLAKEVAYRIVKGNIVAWFQGRMEYGPRALGCRSILADPRVPEMRDRINMLIKKREGFRPFAPAVIEEMASEFFEVDPGDTQLYEYMLCVTQVRKHYQDKLPAITHVNGSARMQTVSKEQNPRFWTVIKEFGNITGIPVLVNTSFNVKGQPIVCTPMEALDTFLFANLDVLVMGNYLAVRKKDQQVTQRQEQKAKELEAAIASN